MSAPAWRGGVPAFLAGGALALGMQVAAGLLLYGGPGLLPALTVVVATGSAALGAGLAAGGRRRAEPEIPPGVGAVVGASLVPGRAIEEVRRRWLFLLVAFTGAAVFSGGWELFSGFEARALSQGAGLALLVALPLYAGGLLLAAPALARTGGAPGGAGTSPAPPAFFGAAFALILLGHLFFPALSPTAVLLLAVVSTSGGALAHGWLLDEIVQVDVADPEAPLVRFRARGTRPAVHRIGWIDSGGAVLVREAAGGPTLARDQALEEALLGLLPPPATVLVSGWRALPTALASAPAEARIRVVDPEPERVRTLLETLPGAKVRGPVEVSRHGEPAGPGDLGEGSVSTWDRVFLAPGGGRPGGNPGPEGWAELRASLSPEGTVVLLDVDEGDGDGGFLEALRGGFVELGSAVGYLGPSEHGRTGFVLAGGVDRVCWPDRVGAFARINVGIEAVG